MADKFQSLKTLLYPGGSIPKPDLNKKYYRLYTHNLCPFAARARYAFAAKGIPFQDVQTNLDQKAQWHLDFNNGFVPVLETPQGDTIGESGVLMQLAHELAPEQGLELVPKDPILAAKMRLKMEKFSGLLGGIFHVYLSRGEDTSKIEEFAKTLPTHNEFASLAKGGKWLLGTDEPTMLDIHVAPMWEVMCIWQHSTLAPAMEHAKFAEQAPDVISYVERFKAHESFKHTCMNVEAGRKHWERTMGWEKGVKCQLSIDVINGVVDGELLS
mmetsp:Transcript_15974/g.34676  ORF Transcript_15974/g.34676 Transcript_15974/m.34676 type:complete len:270 (-) Transcript_15974:106-915(-)|eukprot:CAMPEP_0118934222 /NCGR_PEP_ID=MMETSP1169-20130426/13702_1 /TAXON_ID=36882 /ORGANISM="Pyramimonas obovata, Strain CCMP722" /LENGTH=269 /DNA_ID=CAMNT_0006877099 /DNA_START=81 /DNA_END=890 /DNA_ORIENTATION=+